MNHTRGMTIVEVLVAVLILSVGLLALTTTAAAVSRMIDDGRRATGAAIAATERVELLLGAGCPAVGTGATSNGPYTVAWEVVAPAGARTRMIGVTVGRPTRRGIRADTLRTIQSCP